MAFGGKSKEVNIYSTKTYELVVSYNFKEEVSFIRFCPFPDKVQHLLCVGLSGKMTYDFVDLHAIIDYLIYQILLL